MPAAELIEISPHGFYLTALSVNPHLQFYRSMGGREVSAPDIQLGGELYPQVGFVWTTPSSLMTANGAKMSTSSVRRGNNAAGESRR
jgi:hypothetical protein